nr:mirror-image polydactyly gene 1 protein isoform X1 [Scatophagus argus]
MYTANPKVNAELRQRLPSPATQQLNSPDRPGICLNLDHTDWPQATLHPPELLTACSPSSLTHRRSVSPVSLSSSRPPEGAGHMEMDPTLSRGPSPRAESCRDSPDGGRTSRGPGPGSPTLRRQVVSSDNSFHQDVLFGPITAAPARLEQDKNISFLLKELDTLRDVNKKLLDQLVQKEKELQRREVEEELREERKEAQGWQRSAVVLEEVIAAQKERDQALMSRLLLANEERDEAVLCARQLQQSSELDRSHLEDSDMDVDELLQCVCDADSVHEVEQFGSVLVHRLWLVRQRRMDITAQEMKAVMEERDGSVTKCKQLEQDLIQEREQRASQEEQLKLQRETGGALEVSQPLEAELQVLQGHSSQDLLALPPVSPGEGVSLAGQAPPLLVQLQQLSKEKQKVEAELQRSQEAEREASERVRRLERLVEVLRKKVGTGSLRAVI